MKTSSKLLWVYGIVCTVGVLVMVIITAATIQI